MSIDHKNLPSDVLVESVNFSNNFMIKCEIGRGRFAKVCKVVHKSNQNYVAAAKIIRRFRNGSDTYENILQEIEILQRSKSHPFIVEILDYYISSRDISIILEYSQFGDLYKHIVGNNEPLSEYDAKLVVSQLLEALDYVHRLSIVHLDVKPMKISLCDFGVAKYLQKDTIIRNLVGTPDYAAPEILDFNPIHLNTDIWSVGVVTYFILSGDSPFWAETKEKTFYNVTSMNINYESESLESVSQDAISFMKQTIVRKPEQRAGCSELLKDDWIRGECLRDGFNTSKGNAIKEMKTKMSS